MAAIQTTSETEYWKKRMVTLSSVWNLKSITNTDLKRVQYTELIQVSKHLFFCSSSVVRRAIYKVLCQNLRDKLANFNTILLKFPVLVRGWSHIAFVAVVQPYADASEGKRLCWKICLLNLGVWAAWKIKRLQPFMTRSFMHHPLSGLSYTLLTSMFRYLFSLDSSSYFIFLNYVCVRFTAICRPYIFSLIV